MHLSFQVLTLLWFIQPKTICGAAISNQSGQLVRREEYIDGTGYTTQNIPAINVPLNSNASNEHAWRDASRVYLEVLIPHTSLVATGFSPGGGPRQTLNGGAFAGRVAGGGTRNEVYGTARYGSGYGQYTSSADGSVQYQPVLTLDVSGRGFPHGFPPLSFGNYSGGGEYHNVDRGDLPGVLAPHARPSIIIGSYDAPVYGLVFSSSNRTWVILADVATLETINVVLSLPVAQGGCNLFGLFPQPMVDGPTYGSWTRNETTNDGGVNGYSSTHPTDVAITQFAILPWNVLQFYRGSSVALASLEYENAFARNGNNNTDYWASTPLNTTGVDMNFLNCVNLTIAAAMPIVDPTLIVRSRLARGQIAGIVVGSIAGFLILLVVAGYFIQKRERRRREGK
ncbi:hypothetical protein M408DRAFT_29125 [Serendipita vermifera MAFF 305830]|uniref:Peptidase A1 domain-containing protein n=1 Tax=Serendipita vermifera MAFF 305830 TaxID=933852 RepID=A0A0C3ARP0_SERVB|nr:hypothetical protein M408DRAFT_29125 [Serendipita vermifera MAFF 305830]